MAKKIGEIIRQASHLPLQRQSAGANNTTLACGVLLTLIKSQQILQGVA